MLSKKDIQIFVPNVLLKSNDFICMRPHASLNEYISSYNITFPTEAMMSIVSMPSGCASLNIESNGKNLLISLEGPTTMPYIVDSLTVMPEIMITIEFKPAGLYALTGINQKELTDQTIPYEAANPIFSKLLAEAVEKSTSVLKLVSNLDVLFLTNMYTDCHPQLKYAYKSIVAYSGNITVKELSSNTNYSERQLNRIFNQHMGLSVKSFSRLIRINKTFGLLKKPHNSLSIVSDVMGFHDLSHFIRDFKSVSGLSPQEFRNNMSDFYINPIKF